MDANVLKLIVDAFGGAKSFAEAIESKEQTVYSWLSGHRKMTRTTAKFIKGLPLVKKLCKEGKIVLA